MIRTNRRIRALAVTGSVLALVAANAALAQDAMPVDPAQEPEDAAPGEIVVTAQKRSENLQDVPLSVSVLTGESLEMAARPSIESAAQQVPSLNFLKSGTTLNQTIFLRGVGTATFSIAGEPSVSTVVDGVVYARSGEAFGDLVDIAQMEVLRGPQGTLFGKNASAGVINVTTKMPEHVAGGTVEASYFDKSEYRVKGAFNMPLGPDLAARVTGFAGLYAGNIRNDFNGKRVNGYNHKGLRGQLLYDPSDALRLYIAADYHKNDDDCCAEVIATGVPTQNPDGTVSYSIAAPIFTALPGPQGADTRRVNQNLVTRTKEEGWGVSGQADIGLGELTLTSITAYREWDNTEIRDGDWLPRAYVGFPQLHDTGPQTTNTLTQEFRLTSPGGQFVDYVLGLYYSRAESERTFQRNVTQCSAVAGAPTTVLIPCGGTLAAASTFPTGVATFGSTFKNYAAFGQVTVNVMETLRLIGGLRYSDDRLSVFHSRNTTLAGPGIQPSFPVTPTGTGQPASVFTASTKNDNISGKAALQFDVTPDVMAYASYTRGYKGPAYNVFYNLTATGTNVISPETSDAYEIGLKNTLLGGRMTLNLAAFRADYHNFQANNPDLVAGVVVTRFTNAGEVSTKGVELDLNWRPFDDFTLSGGLAYTDAKVDAFLVAPGAPATAIIPPGTPLGYAPKWKGALAADYRVRTGGAVDVFFGANGNYQSKQLSLFSPNALQRQIGTIPSYGLVNVSAGVGASDESWRLTVQVRNLFDEAYPAAIVNGGPAGSYRYQIPRDADRYWGITGKVNF